jgi:VWFA-related protein
MQRNHQKNPAKRKPSRLLPECQWVAGAPPDLVDQTIEQGQPFLPLPKKAVTMMCNLIHSPRKILFLLLLTVLIASVLTAIIGLAQSGRGITANRRTMVVPMFVRWQEEDGKAKPLLGGAAAENQDRILAKGQLDFYDGGVLQKVESLAPDPSPARIIVLMDNSSTLQCDVKKLAAVPAAFAPEIYEGDKVMVIGYDLKPEIIADFTDDPKDLQNTLSLLRKSDSPLLFDALNVVMEDVLRPQVGFSKRAIVIVADGLDRGSKIKFDKILATLQDENVTVYAVQVKDRTRGALRKDAPKAADALELLTTGTGGKIYSIDSDIRLAAREICDELRNERYQLTYYPEGINPINKRLLLVTPNDIPITVRHKGWHPAKPQ